MYIQRKACYELDSYMLEQSRQNYTCSHLRHNQMAIVLLRYPLLSALEFNVRLVITLYVLLYQFHWSL